ncbi:MAG TPA: C4-dicarboxylate ABC transporter substrate-binding protein, partial [Alcanivorax sp.]|nr:C4-dicarboxylate ABC transporter substrate-binding protein [Alcanivorax sp.]
MTLFQRGALCLAALVLAGLTQAADNVKLPGTIAMTAYGTGSAGYTQMVS